MKYLTLACVVAALAAQGEQGDLDKLQGTWKVEKAEFGGTKFEGDKVPLDTIIIKDKKMTVRSKGKDAMTFEIRLDPAQKPKHMQWLKAGEKNELPGIYEIDGDTLRLAFPLLAKKGDPPIDIQRPANFDSEKKAVGVLEAKRAKSE